MSEQPVSAPPRRDGNVFTHRLGPFPTWVWIAIAAALVLAWSLYKGRTASAKSASQTTPSTPADQVPQFVNQTFTTVTPPTTNITVNDQDVTGTKHPKPPPRRPPPPHRGGEEPGVHDIAVGGGRGRRNRVDTYMSTGRQSANQLAKMWHEPVETILQTSASHNDSDALEAYIHQHNWNKKIPPGVRLYIPEDLDASQYDQRYRN